MRVCLTCIKKLHFCYENIRDFTEANQKLVQLLKEEDEMLKRGPEQPIPLLLIENNDSNAASQPEEPQRLRIINEKLVQVDKSLPTPEQIAQVIETIKAGLGTDSNGTLSTLFHTSPKQSLENQQEHQDPSKTYKCSVCSEHLPDYFTLIQHQLLKFQCRTCRSRFCSYKSRRAHYRDLHLGSAKFMCPKCGLGFVTKNELRSHKRKVHPLFCECCRKNFISKLALSAHVKHKMKSNKFVCKKCGPNCKIQSHSLRDKESFSCEECDLKFESRTKLNVHNEHHVEGYGQSRYECKYCAKRFNVKNKLSRHMKFHMEKQIQCPICPRKFTISTELKYHMEVHANERKFECDLCQAKFLHKVHLIKHIRNKHLQQNYFLCQICEAKFDTKSEVESHCASHTINSKVNHLTLYQIITPFQCALCSKFYSTKYSLDKHLQRHKDKELGLYLMCEFCGQHFASKSRLQSHLREHTNSTQVKPKPSPAALKRYVCQVCSQRYSTTVQLLAHMACHTGIKPFKCSFCEATFTTKMNKNNHELKHKGIKNYICQYCQKAFYAHYNLVLHLRTHTKEKPYKCTFCPKAFPRRSNLTTHLRVHTGDRPYVCNVCDHAFSQKTSRDKHLLIHTQQYRCEQCEVSFGRKKELTDHVSNVHSISNMEEDMLIMPKDSVILSQDETDEHMEEAKFQIQIIEQEVITYDEPTAF
ncbi:hypothetical protein B566_EDAN012085 [Ephemera danica]|nr:hypothetical protein B566_EDAN012085 [Ephemera danica]